jgi:hypothetical protein
MTAELLDQFPNTDRSTLKEVVSMIKDGDRRTATAEFGKIAHKASKIIDYYRSSNHKLAIDDKAKSYFESYFGMYGKDLVSEIKKRVRADLAKAWLKKGGVEASAADLWSKYYGAFASDWVKVVPGLISPRSH